MSYRYGYNYNSLTNAEALLNLNGPGLSFVNGNIDGYSDWTLMTTPAGINEPEHFMAVGWRGQHKPFFHAGGIVQSERNLAAFRQELLAAGNTNSTYEHYTFYRLLSQLGTDSTPESGKMNLNYDQSVDINRNDPIIETNSVSWTNPSQFFTNAADRLLRAYTTQWRNSNPTNFATEFYTVPAKFVIQCQPSGPSLRCSRLPSSRNIAVLVSNQFSIHPPSTASSSSPPTV